MASLGYKPDIDEHGAKEEKRHVNEKLLGNVSLSLMMNRPYSI